MKMRWQSEETDDIEEVVVNNTGYDILCIMMNW
jgi:hypothetical protein